MDKNKQLFPSSITANYVDKFDGMYQAIKLVVASLPENTVLPFTTEVAETHGLLQDSPRSSLFGLKLKLIHSASIIHLNWLAAESLSLPGSGELKQTVNGTDIGILDEQDQFVKLEQFVRSQEIDGCYFLVAIGPDAQDLLERAICRESEYNPALFDSDGYLINPHRESYLSEREDV